MYHVDQQALRTRRNIADAPSASHDSVVLRFIKHGEFLRVGDRFLFREGRVRTARYDAVRSRQYR